MRTIVEFAASAIVMLLVTIGPLETAAIFGVLTAGARRRMRVRLALQAVAIGGGILIVFAIGGTKFLQLLQVSMPAFEVAAGILLLLQSIELIFAHPGGLSALTAGEEREAELSDEIAVFFLMLLIALAITYGTLMLVEPLGRILGVTGTNVIARISGILLAALAVQFIFNGIRDSHLLG